MVCHGDGLPRASGAERIVFLQYNVHGRLSFPITMVMVMVNGKDLPFLKLECNSRIIFIVKLNFICDAYIATKDARGLM